MMNKKALFFFLYFFEGAPIGLIWWTVPTLLSVNGITVDTITMVLALANVPWTIKFLAGPVVDRFLYRNKHYACAIAGLQLGMLLALLLLMLFSVSSPWLPGILLLLSSCSASQDVVIDAWAIASIDKGKRGTVNGAMQAGMLSGRWLFGPGLLVALAWFDWKMAVAVLMALVLCSIVFLFFRFRKSEAVIAPILKKLQWKSLSFIFTRRFIFLALLALLSGFALESITSVAAPMLVKQGYDESKVGWLLSGTLLLMLSGSLLGGKLSDRFEARKIFFLSGLILAPVIIFAGYFEGLAMNSMILLFLYMAYILVGIFTASSYTFYMNQAHGAMEATKFTFLMAITNLCEAAAGSLTGQLAVEPGSYLRAFTVCAIVSLVGIGMLKQKKLALVV